MCWSCLFFVFSGLLHPLSLFYLNSPLDYIISSVAFIRCLSFVFSLALILRYIKDVSTFARVLLTVVSLISYLGRFSMGSKHFGWSFCVMLVGCRHCIHPLAILLLCFSFDGIIFRSLGCSPQQARELNAMGMGRC